MLGISSIFFEEEYITVQGLLSSWAFGELAGTWELVRVLLLVLLPFPYLEVVCPQGHCFTSKPSLVL